MMLALHIEAASGAGLTVGNPDDNYYVRVVDWSAEPDRTRLLIATYPDIRQPQARAKCNANYYLLDLVPNLTGSQPQVLTTGHCMSGFTTWGGVLNNGDILIAGNRVEIWRPGTGQINAWSFSEVGALAPNGRTIRDGLLSHVAADGLHSFAYILPRSRNDTSSTSAVAVGTTLDGSTRWQVTFAEPGILVLPLNIWTTSDGGALIHALTRSLTRGSAIPGSVAPPGALIIEQNRLYRVSPQGTLSPPLVIANMQMMDMSNPAALPDPSTDPAGFQKALTQQTELFAMESYSSDQLLGQPRDDGSVDVLLGRGTKNARWMHISKSGQMLMDKTLDELLADEGVLAWQDGYVVDDEVFLFGTLGTRRDRLAQGYVSRIDPMRGQIATRLAPLSELGLEEARQAGDEEVQYLEHNPSHAPQALAQLAGAPITVSTVHISRQPAFQIDQITSDLVLYTEVRDLRAAELAKKQQRQQRKIEREASKQQMNEEMAAAIGATPEEYAAMSDR
jgi:hypothetical protein